MPTYMNFNPASIDDVINGNGFHVAGPLCGESIGNQCLPQLKDR